MKLVKLGVLAIAFFTTLHAHADLRRFVHVADGIYRADQPDHKEDYQTLKDLGVKTIINLRHESDWQTKESIIAAMMGFGYRSYPMKPWEYPSDKKVNAIMADLTDPKLQPVFIHCQAGKDRTGMIIGLYRVHVENWSSDKAYAEMRSLGFNPLLIPLWTYFRRNTFLPETVVATQLKE